MEWVLTNRVAFHIRVVNMSLGAAGGLFDGTDATSVLVNQLTAAGVVVVVAAGNSGPGSGSVNIPGVARYAITSGAMRGGDRGRSIAVFSSRGPTADGRVKPDLLAPGVDITAAWYNPDQTAPVGHATYMRESGTSMATPFVAAMTALLLQADPALAPSGTACTPSATACTDGVVDTSMSTPSADLLRSTAEDWGPPGPDNDHGAGVVRTFAALRAAEHSSEAGPPYPGHAWRTSLLRGTDDAQAWPFTVTAGAPIRLTLRLPPVEYFKGQLVDVDVYDPAGGLVRTEWDVAGGPTINLGPSAIGQQGGWFRPATDGTYYAVVRSVRGSISYGLDIDAATVVGSNASPPGVSQPVGTRVIEGSSHGAPFAVALGRTPAASVTVAITNDAGLVATPNSLTFTPSNWSSTQTVTLTAGAESVGEGPHTARIALTTPNASLADTTVQVFSVPVTDRDSIGPQGATERINLTPGGAESKRTSPDWNNDRGQRLFISPDGRYVAFSTRASDLVPGDTNEWPDVFLRDRQTATTERVSISSSGDEIPATSHVFGMSDDGNRVLFRSSPGATAVVPNDTNGEPDLFIRDRRLATTQRVNLTSTGGQMPGQACGYGVCPLDGKLSGDGNTVTFITQAKMTADDSDALADLFVRNLAAGTTTRVSLASGGLAGSGGGGVAFAGVSRDGGRVVFNSDAAGLVAGHGNWMAMYSHDVASGVTALLNVDSTGVEIPIDAWAKDPALSPNGRFALFGSPGGAGFAAGMYLRDLSTHTTTLVSRRPDGSLSTNEGHPLDVNNSGDVVTWLSWDDGILGPAQKFFGSVRRDLTSNKNSSIAVDLQGAGPVGVGVRQPRRQVRRLRVNMGQLRHRRHESWLRRLPTHAPRDNGASHSERAE